MKEEILVDLQKYKPGARTVGLTNNFGDKIHKGGLNLRTTVNQIMELLGELEKYRPSIGGFLAFAGGLNMHAAPALMALQL
eukprot:365800-Chlamydomonas_euryale.AAC.26